MWTLSGWASQETGRPSVSKTSFFCPVHKLIHHSDACENTQVSRSPRELNIAPPWTEKVKVASFDLLTYTDRGRPSWGRLKSEYMTCHFHPQSSSFLFHSKFPDVMRADMTPLFPRLAKGLYLAGL